MLICTINAIHFIHYATFFCINTRDSKTELQCMRSKVMLRKDEKTTYLLYEK